MNDPKHMESAQRAYDNRMPDDDIEFPYEIECECGEKVEIFSDELGTCTCCGKEYNFN